MEFVQVAGSNATDTLTASQSRFSLFATLQLRLGAQNYHRAPPAEDRPIAARGAAVGADSVWLSFATAQLRYAVRVTPPIVA